MNSQVLPKLYRFGEFQFDWIAAEDREQAIQFYRSFRDDWDLYAQLYARSGDTYGNFVNTFVQEQDGFSFVVEETFKDLLFLPLNDLLEALSLPHFIGTNRV